MNDCWRTDEDKEAVNEILTICQKYKIEALLDGGPIRENGVSGTWCVFKNHSSVLDVFEFVEREKCVVMI